MDRCTRTAGPPMLTRTTIRTVWPPTAVRIALLAVDHEPTMCCGSVSGTAGGDATGGDGFGVAGLFGPPACAGAGAAATVTTIDDARARVATVSR
ncbi:hypothetical protein Pth03_75350 [Planotetraspora thailandica]|uniref:Uncharacterized protein n=1 Tax=Planotetraspora thailandica TaxID=487172 RepID=A0A8J4DEW8_9ACTN|nr:hypothetical protein Pth03_75350 [Planotetraspora thailandica]